MSRMHAPGMAMPGGGKLGEDRPLAARESVTLYETSAQTLRNLEGAVNTLEGVLQRICPTPEKDAHGADACYGGLDGILVQCSELSARVERLADRIAAKVGRETCENNPGR